LSMSPSSARAEPVFTLHGCHEFSVRRRSGPFFMPRRVRGHERDRRRRGSEICWNRSRGRPGTQGRYARDDAPSRSLRPALAAIPGPRSSTIGSRRCLAAAAVGVPSAPRAREETLPGLQHSRRAERARFGHGLPVPNRLQRAFSGLSGPLFARRSAIPRN
jgi:hypothetical protein